MADAWVGLDAAFAELEAECTDIIRGVTVRVWNGVLSKTPQFDGRMAASWTYCVNSPQFYDRSSQVDPQGEKLPAHRYRDLGGFKGLYPGQPLALAVANAASAGKDKAYRLGDTVYLTNGVNHGEGAYSQDIEDGNIRLRAENQPGAPARRTIDWANVHFAPITAAKARTLKNLTIGQNDPS